MDPKTSRLLEYWDIVMLVACTVVAFYVPFEMAFLHCEAWSPGDCLSFALDIVFVTDMALQFRIAVPRPDNPLVYNYNSMDIARGYLSGRFWVDILSLFHGLRLCRLLRLRRLPQLKQRFRATYGTSNSTLSLATCVCQILVVSHWSACVWGFLARGSKPRTWLTELQEVKGGDDAMYTSTSSVYIMSLYWAFVTVTGVGYGDITPQDDMEYAVSTVCIFFGALTWAYVIGEICGIVATLNPHEVKFKQMVDDLNCFMEERYLSEEMCRGLRRYFFEKNSICRRRDQDYLFREMSPMLRAQVAFQVHEKLIRMVWYLQDLPHEAVARVAARIRTELYAPKEEVPHCRALHIVQRGLCMWASRVLVKGAVWGEDMVLSNACLRRGWNVHAITYLEVGIIDYGSLAESVSEVPDAAAKFGWARVRLAIMRAVVTIAQGMKRLIRVFGEEVHHLDPPALMQLYTDLLQGKDVASLACRARLEQ